MSKKRKSKKNKRPNVYDSRPNLTISKTERERNYLQTQVNKYNRNDGFQIEYKPTSTIDKTSGRILVTDVVCSSYSLTHNNHNGPLTRKPILLGMLSHAWIETSIVNNLSTCEIQVVEDTNTSNSKYDKGVSMACIGSYERMNGTMSICFTKASPLKIAEEVGFSSYTDFWKEAFITIYYDIDLIIKCVEEIMLDYLQIHSNININVAKLYIKNCRLGLHLASIKAKAATINFDKFKNKDPYTVHTEYLFKKLI